MVAIITGRVPRYTQSLHCAHCACKSSLPELPSVTALFNAVPTDVSALYYYSRYGQGANTVPLLDPPSRLEAGRPCARRRSPRAWDVVTLAGLRHDVMPVLAAVHP